MVEWGDWCRRALAWSPRHPEPPSLLQARLLGVASDGIASDDLPAAVAGLERAVEIGRQTGPDGRQYLMMNLADLARNAASLNHLDQAAAASAGAVEILRELGPDSFPPGRYVYYQAYAAAFESRLANKRGQFAEAKLLAAESIRLYEEAGFGVGEFDGRLELGHACLELGEYDAARSHFQRVQTT